MNSFLSHGPEIAQRCVVKINGFEQARKHSALSHLERLVSPSTPGAFTPDAWEGEFLSRINMIYSPELLAPLPGEATVTDLREKIERLQSALDMTATLQRFLDDKTPHTALRRVVSVDDPALLHDLMIRDPKQFLARICTTAAKLNASDIIWKVGASPLLKVSDKILAIDSQALSQEDMARIFIDNLMSPLQAEHFHESLSLDKGLTLDGVPDVRFRANIFHQSGNIGCIMRLIPKNTPTVEELGLPLQIKELTQYQQGLIIITGPTGSGKSTTLSALIGLINETSEKHIITIEDPIEFVHEDRLSVIEQRETRVDTPSFEEGIRDSLRQAPNVLLIGELRDQKTMTAALHAAETGHLVFTTLHTNSAAETLARIKGFYETDGEKKQICSSLARNVLGILSQKLVPTSDGTGRVCAMEVMIASPTVKQYLEDDKIGDIEKLIEDDTFFKMQSMQAALLAHVSSGAITRETAIEYAPSVSSMKQALRRI